MELKHYPALDISEDVLAAIRSFSLHRKVEHCGSRFLVSPFDFYGKCPQCGTRMKVRSFSGRPEIQDLFDAVFEWLNQPAAQELARKRQMEIAADLEG